MDKFKRNHEKLHTFDASITLQAITFLDGNFHNNHFSEGQLNGRKQYFALLADTVVTSYFVLYFFQIKN